jgi:uncharacterized protein
MSRIQRAYELKWRNLLVSIGTRRLDKGLEYLTSSAETVCHQRGMSFPEALGIVYQKTHERIRHVRVPVQREEARFLCDAGLGGLARWLRAAGYEARWRLDIHDQELIREAQREGLTIVTTDSLLMERRVIRSGELKAVWIPPALRARQQLAAVLNELRLPVLESRCMGCGGVLQRVDKEAVRDQIPARTYQWLEEFWRCSACGKLFWQGTHYERIRRHLPTRGN